MDPARWREIKATFADVQALPASERTAALAALSDDLRREVRSLLDASDASPGRLDGDRVGPVVTGEPDEVPARIGPWRIVRSLGHGGMGVVYLGERLADDVMVRAAVKVVNSATRGQVFAERFRSERRILASLDHPGIARFLDGGTTDDGLPYFALEYVDGVPLAEHIAQHQPDLRARLALVRQVCDAVSFAHSRLVVHRDLKPGNILVTAAGTTKLLDFGIAKVLEDDTVSGSGTVTAQGWMTPAYASPEQVRGEPTTTASDVYSLGLVLYEVLVGRAAIARDTPPMEVVKAKLDGTIPRPSTAALRVARTDGGSDAKRRASALRGDLDTIVMTALAVDPARRYGSVAALSDEIDRYLDGRPIRARGDGWTYRAAKFVRRHRWAVGASTAAAVALVAAAAVATRQAQLASARFDQVRGLATSMMFELHDAVAPLPDSLEARRLIVDRSVAYLDALARDADASEEVQREVVRGYLRLASILGSDLDSAGLGQSGDALTRITQAVQVARRLVDKSPPSAAGRLALAESLEALADAHNMRGRAADAEAAGREAIAVAASVVRERPGEITARARLATATRKTGTAVMDGGRLPEGTALLREALALERLLYEAGPSTPERQLGLSAAHHFLGVALIESGDLAAAETTLREALRLDELRYAASPALARADVADDLLQLSQVVANLKRLDEAAELLARVVELRREAATAQPRSNMLALRVGAALDRLAVARARAGAAEAAVAPAREALAITSRVAAADPGNDAAAREHFLTVADLGVILMRAGQPREACPMAARAVALGTPHETRWNGAASMLKMSRDVLASCGRATPRAGS